LEKLGFPWILSSESSLFNGLRAIFCGNIFVPLLGRRGGARRCCRLAALVMTPAQSGGPLSLGSTSGILSFNLGPVVRWSPKPRFHEVVVGFWQENVGNSDSRIDVSGDLARRFRRDQGRSPQRHWIQDGLKPKTYQCGALQAPP